MNRNGPFFPFFLAGVWGDGVSGLQPGNVAVILGEGRGESMQDSVLLKDVLLY